MAKQVVFWAEDSAVLPPHLGRTKKGIRPSGKLQRKTGNDVDENENREIMRGTMRMRMMIMTYMMKYDDNDGWIWLGCLRWWQWRPWRHCPSNMACATFYKVWVPIGSRGLPCVNRLLSLSDWCACATRVDKLPDVHWPLQVKKIFTDSLTYATSICIRYDRRIYFDIFWLKDKYNIYINANMI